MKVLIFGCGCIGKSLGKFYNNNGHDAKTLSKDDCDVTDYNAVNNRIRSSQYDLIINCAGVYHNEDLIDITPSKFHEMISVNLIGTLNILLAARHSFSGKVVIITSIAAKDSSFHAEAYALSKKFQDDLACKFNWQYYPVFIIRPKMVDTPMFRSDNPDYPKALVMQPDIFAIRLAKIIDENALGEFEI